MTAEYLPGQTELFDDQPLVGIEVETFPCRCGNRVLTICGQQSKTHAALLVCPRCHRSAGWLSKAAAAFVADTVKHFGRPERPIVIRQK